MDVFSQVVWGTRVALLVGLLSAVGSADLGTVVGLVAGYFGGWVDEILMRRPMSLSAPFLPFAMVVISIARPSSQLDVLLIVVFLVAITAR